MILDLGKIGALLGLVTISLAVAFVAASEASLTTLSRTSARRLIDAGVPRAKALQALLQDPPRYVATLMIAKAAAFLAGAGLIIWLTLDLGLQWRIGVPVALLALGALLVGIQIVARAVAMRSLESTALRLGPAVRFLARLLSPLTAPLRSLGYTILGRKPDADSDDLFLSEDGLRLLINVGEEPGLIEEEEKEMIASIFELGETVAREVMVPRIDIVAVDESTDLQRALDVIIAAGHSRIPVYRNTVDNIQGVLYAKDLLGPFREGRQDVSIVDLMRPAYFVPESKKVDELLRELQQRKVHMAIVVDEYGGTAGVVTIEDLLEEIVGDIQDEYDRESPMVVESGEDVYVFDARIGLDEVSRLVDYELPTEESDTLGGFIYSRLGRVPSVGNQVAFGPLTMEVQSISGRRIQQVKVTRQRDSDVDQTAAEAQPRRASSVLSSLL